MAESSGKFVEVENGLKFEGRPSYEEWAACGSRLHMDHRNAHWRIGDWLNAGEDLFGEDYAQAVDETEFTISTQQKAKYLSKRFPIERRTWPLGHSYYEAVAAIEEPDVRDRLLGLAYAEGWSRDTLRIEAKQYKPRSADIMWTDDDEDADDSCPARQSSKDTDATKYPDAPGDNIEAAAQDVRDAAGPDNIIPFPTQHIDMSVMEFVLTGPNEMADLILSGPIYLRGPAGQVLGVVTSYDYFMALQTIQRQTEQLALAPLAEPLYMP